MNRATLYAQAARLGFLLGMLLLLPLAGVASESPPDAAPQSTGSPFAVRWHTQDGGGGDSEADGSRIRGSIAQPDADPLQPSTGGAFAVTGGFWQRAGESEPLAPDIFRDGFE